MADSYQSGFLRDVDGNLVVATGTGTVAGGHLRDSDGALVIVDVDDAVAPAWDGGFILDSEQLVTSAGDVGDHTEGGFVRDSTGAVVTVAIGDATGVHWEGGFIRDEDGLLVVA